MVYVLLLSILSIFNNPREEAKVKALYINSFMRNMEWPSEKSDDKYVIAVIGEPLLVEQIRSLTNNQLINNKAVEVMTYRPDIKLREINILCLSKESEKELTEFKKLAVQHSVLLITEFKSALEKGAAINFITQNGKLGFELNTSTLQKAQLKASKNLLKMADSFN